MAKNGVCCCNFIVWASDKMGGRGAEAPLPPYFSAPEICAEGFALLCFICVCINYTMCTHHFFFASLFTETLFLFRTIVAKSELLAMHVDF